MNCFYHEDKKANFKCVECGNMICKDCAVNNNGEILCRDCAEDIGLTITKTQVQSKVIEENCKYNGMIYTPDSRKISGFWTTVFSFLPGAGHFYLGLMKRGLQLMLTFFGIIAISNLLNSDILTPFTVIVWFYSVFDCYHIRKKLKNGEGVEDDMIIEMDVSKINSKQTGIILVVIGGLLLLNEIFTQMMFMLDRYRVYYYIFRFLRGTLFPGLLILSGVVLLKKARKQNAA